MNITEPNLSQYAHFKIYPKQIHSVDLTASQLVTLQRLLDSKLSDIATIFPSYAELSEYPDHLGAYNKCYELLKLFNSVYPNSGAACPLSTDPNAIG